MSRYRSTLSTKAIHNQVLAALGLLASLAPAGCLVASGDPGGAGQDPTVESSSVRGAPESAQDAGAGAYAEGRTGRLKPGLPWGPTTWESPSPPAKRPGDIPWKRPAGSDWGVPQGTIFEHSVAAGGSAPPEAAASPDDADDGGAGRVRD